MPHVRPGTEPIDSSDHRARGGHRTGTAGGPGKLAVAKDLRLAAASKLSTVFCRAADFVDWNLDAKHGPGMAGVSIDAIQTAVGSGGGGGFSAHDAFLDLGRVGGG